RAPPVYVTSYVTRPKTERTRPPSKHRDASSPKRPRHHLRELFSPERVAVRSDPVGHHDVRTCIAQRGRPSGRILVEERLQCAGHKVRARKRAGHHVRRSVTRARRGAEDRTVDVRMPKPDGERKLSTR